MKIKRLRLRLHWWFGAWWFGIALKIPKIVSFSGIPLESKPPGALKLAKFGRFQQILGQLSGPHPEKNPSISLARLQLAKPCQLASGPGKPIFHKTTQKGLENDYVKLFQANLN